MVFGEQLRALRIVEAALGTVAVALIGWVGTGLFGRRAGLFAAAIAAMHPVLAYLPSTQYSENTLVLALALAFGALFAGCRREGLWRWALTGALFGMLILIRPNLVFMLPGLAIGVLAALRAARRRWLAPALVAFAALSLTVAPWIVRNHERHGRWYFVAIGGGRSFWYSNNPRATAETWNPIRPDSAMTAELNRLPDDVDREHFYYRRGMEFVRAEPARASWLYLAELRNLFALYPEPITRIPRPLRGRIAQGIASVVIFAGTLLALPRWRAEPALWVFAGAIVSFSLVSACYLSLLRYRMAIEPCLIWAAGLGWSATWSRLTRR